jgi:hypothetical protein
VHADLLTDWEKGFVENLMGWTGSPTSKQMERIEIIYSKVKARAPK